MRVTIRDIARECGCSTAAVSLALGDKKGRVSPDMARRIRETAARLQYTPNRAAVSLATRHTKLIGVLTSDLRNTHIAALFMTIAEVLQAGGYTLICHVLDENRSGTRRITNELMGMGIEGILYAQPLYINPNDEFERLRDFLNGAGVPVISNDEIGLTCAGADVIFDFYQAGYLATKQLIEGGHTVIGCVSGPAHYKVSADRLAGYRRALDEAGIPFDPKLIFYGDYSTPGAEPALSYLLGQKATAIFSFNDEMAFAIYQSARQYGLRIPADVSVIGCDNVPFSNVLEVPLSTVHVPREEMGREMAQRLIASIGGDTTVERTKHVYEPVLMIRGSIARR
jgi:LacI family transcriptional regulator